MEAGTDDQILSLSGCPVTEVYSKEMCGKQTGFLRRTCAVTTHDQIRSSWLYLRMALWQDFKEKKKTFKSSWEEINIQFQNLSQKKEKEKEKNYLTPPQTQGLVPEFGKMLRLLNSVKILQPDPKLS